MRTRLNTPDRSWLIAGALLLVARSAGAADTTVPVTGIGTSLTAGAFTINTHADSVTYSAPVDVVIHGIPAVEVRGVVSGVGWGGVGVVPRAADAHYRYELPFVARWPKSNPAARLVFYNHGGGVSLIGAVKRDKLSGAANPNRFAELNGDLLIGVPALLDGATYISTNRRGQRGDGKFSAFYLAPVATLTAAEVATVVADLATAPGNPGFSQPGIAAGEPVPVLPTNDAPTCRDVARALEQVLAGLVGRPYRTRIGTGTSSGARLLAALNFGRSAIPGRSLQTGGNHAIPYDASSPRIYDGFLLMGFGYSAGAEQVDAAFPLSAPVMLIQGQGDERYQQHVTLAHELLQKGVSLPGRVWLYDIENLTHVTRDVVNETTTSSDGDRLACFASAAIRNLRACVEEGGPPPVSRLAGRVCEGALGFTQARGFVTNVAPVPQDPYLDAYVVDANLTPRTLGAAETARWLAVTRALPHVPQAIRPPTVACRLGGYKLMFFGSPLAPFSSADLIAKYGSFESYRECVRRMVACLEAWRLYDARVESADETAERARALFSP